MSKTTPPPNTKTTQENPDDDILNHPLFCDGLPSNFQDNAAFNALAYIDSEEYHPKSPINTNSIKNRTPTTPREIQNQLKSGPVRRQKSGLNRRQTAQPYGNGGSRGSVGGFNDNEEEYNAFGHRRRSSVKMRSRNSDGPLARESHLASYLCSIADDEHSLPKKPNKFPIETVFPERVSFSSSQAPGLLTLPEGDVVSHSELDLNSMTSRATSETREDGTGGGHTSPPKLVAPCATPTTSVGRDGGGSDAKKSSFVIQQLQQHASQIPIPDDTFGSRLNVPDDASHLMSEESQAPTPVSAVSVAQSQQSKTSNPDDAALAFFARAWKPFSKEEEERARRLKEEQEANSKNNSSGDVQMG